MTERSPDINKKVDDWLMSLGFTLGNPFASVEAERERDKLPRFFVDVPGMAEIKGLESIIIFAPRGGGKSALRVMLANDTAPRDASKPIFSVEFTDFDGLIKHARQKTLDSEIGVSELLKVGVKAIFSLLVEEPERFVLESTKIKLSQFLHEYAPFLLTPQTLFQFFEQLTPAVSLTQMKVTWKQFQQIVEDRNLLQLSAKFGRGSYFQLLAELNDFASEGTAVPFGPVLRLKEFRELCQEIGFKAVYFLIDRVDEFPDTANNPILQANLLAPFLGHLPLLEMEGVALKFFLPDMVREQLENSGWLRTDRIPMKAVSLDWDVKHLIQLLNDRMRVYSQKAITDLGQISESKAVAAEIERWLGTSESPRQLLLDMQKLCDAHVMRAGLDGLLTTEDLATVKRDVQSGEGKEEFEISSTEQKTEESFVTSEGIPLLRLNFNQHVAWLGKTSIELTVTEFNVLRALVEEDTGRCHREKLAERVWGTKEGVSDTTIDRNISRIRHKLNDTKKDHWIYLITIRGWGFQLKNFTLLK